MKLSRPAHLPRFSDPAPAKAPTSHQPLPDIRNEDAVLALDEYRAIEIRGRGYRVPPVPYKDGRRLDRVQLKLYQLQSEKPTEELIDKVDATIDEARVIAKRLLIPLGLRRWLWRVGIRPDPLDGCTDKEIGAVLSFLYRCRTNASVRLSTGLDRRHALT